MSRDRQQKQKGKKQRAQSTPTVPAPAQPAPAQPAPAQPSPDLEIKYKIVKSLERRDWSKTIRTVVGWICFLVALYMSQYIPKEILELLADILRDWKTLVTSIIIFILAVIGYFSSRRFEIGLSSLTPEDVGGSSDV